MSIVIVRSGRLPMHLGWLGLLIGATGIASVLPPLNDATVAFGLLQIVWFAWLGAALLTTKPPTPTVHSSTVDIRNAHLTEVQR